MSYEIAPKVPRAFVDNVDVKYVLGDIINDFNHEEKVAIYFYYTLGLTIGDLAESTELSCAHVESVLNLYSERLTVKLCFFQTFVPYHPKDVMPVSELLFLEPTDE